MATINRIEEIEAWQKARELSKRIYSATGRSEFARDFGLRDQIQRASVSMVSNIAEGFERDGNAEFIQFLSHAKGSAGEVKAQLYLALDLRYIASKEFDDLFALATETGRMIAGLIQYLRSFFSCPARSTEIILLSSRGRQPSGDRGDLSFPSTDCFASLAMTAFCTPNN